MSVWYTCHQEPLLYILCDLNTNYLASKLCYKHKGDKLWIISFHHRKSPVTFTYSLETRWWWVVCFWFLLYKSFLQKEDQMSILNAISHIYTPPDLSETSRINVLSTDIVHRTSLPSNKSIINILRTTDFACTQNQLSFMSVISVLMTTDTVHRPALPEMSTINLFLKTTYTVQRTSLLA